MRRKRRGEHGAAAVEFAILATVFFSVLFGIIDFGFYFNDAVSTRHGVREAARQGVVSNWGTSTSCGSGSLDKLRCQTKSNIGSLTGTVTVKVHVPTSTWKKGDKLVVCARVTGSGAIGFVPLPSGTQSRTEMVIETAANPPTGGWSSADSGTSGWTWC